MQKAEVYCVVKLQGRIASDGDIQLQLTDQTLNYWCKSKTIPRVDDVDWSSMAKATRAMRRGKGIFLTKFFSGISGVNKWRNIWGLVPSKLVR